MSNFFTGFAKNRYSSPTGTCGFQKQFSIPGWLLFLQQFLSQAGCFPLLRQLLLFISSLPSSLSLHRPLPSSYKPIQKIKVHLLALCPYFYCPKLRHMALFLKALLSIKLLFSNQIRYYPWHEEIVNDNTQCWLRMSGNAHFHVVLGRIKLVAF